MTVRSAVAPVVPVAPVADKPAARWDAVFHRTNGWMHAPDGAYFKVMGETVELVGGVHRCGAAWYASSITHRRDHA